MNNELLALMEYIEQERGISRDIIAEALEQAIASASQKSIHPASEIKVEVDRQTGDIKAWAKLEVVDGLPNNDQIVLARAREKFPEVKPGDVIDWEVTPSNFGRIAAQTAKQTIMQQFRKAEKANVKEQFDSKIGEIVNGVVRRFEGGAMIVDLQKAEGIISHRDKIPGEQYRIGDRVNAVLIGVDTMGAGPSLILSRTDDRFVKRLFEREVAEIHDGVVEIKGIAREPGSRTKIAVHSGDPRVDPIGACVGLRGMRVKNITAELSGERIDIIRYDEDLQTYAANALQPAVPKYIEINQAEHLLTVHVASDQARLAFGKRAQNVRLSSKLLSWRFEIIEDKDAKRESFEDQMAKAIENLSESLGIGVDKAGLLVNNGYISPAGLKEAGDEALAGIDGLEEEDIGRINAALADME